MPDKLNILVAVPYMNGRVVDVLKRNADSIRFLLDSGAFTAWKAGKVVGVDDYCRFLDKLPIKPWRYFTLDVIGDPDGTMANYETMLKRGFRPVPIFTRGEDVSVLEDYYKTSDLVAIGGLVQTRGNKGFVNGVMKQVGNRKVHWLGFTLMEFVKSYFPYSVDTSSWSMAFRYASGLIFADNMASTKITKSMFRKRPTNRLSALIREHSVDPADLALNREWSNGNKARPFAIELLTHRTWVRLMLQLEGKDCKLFMACSTEGQVRLTCDAFRYWKKHENGSNFLGRDGLGHLSQATA